MRKAAVLVCAFGLTSCVMWFPPIFPPDVSGPYATSLSPADLREIKLLIGSRRDIAKPIAVIQVLRQDMARVSTGSFMYGGGKWSDIRLYKRRGKWTIDESTVHVYRLDNRLTTS